MQLLAADSGRPKQGFQIFLEDVLAREAFLVRLKPNVHRTFKVEK